MLKQNHLLTEEYDLRKAWIRSQSLLVAKAADHVGRFDRPMPSPWIVQSASDVLFEQQMRALECVCPSIDITEEDGTPASPSIRIALSRLIATAAPVLWDHELREHVVHLSPPALDCDDLELSPAMQWWTFPTDLVTPTGERIICLLIGKMPGFGIAMTMLRRPPSTPGGDDASAMGYGINHFAFKSGERWPDMIDRLIPRMGNAEREAVSASVGVIISMITFLASPYVPVEMHTVPRSEARRAHSTPSRLPQVRFVSLRRVVLHADPENAHVDNSEEHRIYRSRWLVSGHIRRQWYASVKAHRAIYIPPHMKGPADGALVRKVFHAVR